ncbi:porin family protein [Flavobacterium sp. 5]|uniref:porin family protein n=1 Tax=Flavobacterium sp. 5 TaxID=2035199 RepID=UPI000C2BC206|nr:porin family protein [Flavobacterium sp. 5]PKB17029.1 outer membrane protein with beta-barrel domain [Flavobacterium sp. 5]
MKSLKIVLLGAFIMLVSNTVSAQKWGIRAGANISDVNVDGLDTSSKTGLYVGIYKEIPLIKSLLFIQPEVQYSQEGFKTKGVEDTKIDYLTVPILAKIYVAKIVSFETGPQFGFKISDNINKTFADVKDFVPSWAFGASLNLPLGLSINARYISALNDNFEVKNGLNNTFDSGKNQVFQIGAAFQF